MSVVQMRREIDDPIENMDLDLAWYREDDSETTLRTFVNLPNKQKMKFKIRLTTSKYYPFDLYVDDSRSSSHKTIDEAKKETLNCIKRAMQCLVYPVIEKEDKISEPASAMAVILAIFQVICMLGFLVTIWW